MSWDSAFFYPHTVSIRSLSSRGGMGAGHGAARTVAAEVRDEQQMVLNSDGEEVLSTSQVTVAIAEDVPLGSLVTVWQGLPGERQAVVLAVNREVNPAPLGSFQVLSLK